MRHMPFVAVTPANAGEVRSGDFLTVRPAHVMTHDNTGAVIPKFQAIGATRVADPRQPVFTLDHDVQNKAEENLAKYAKIEDFAARMGVHFYGAGRGQAEGALDLGEDPQIAVERMTGVAREIA